MKDGKLLICDTVDEIKKLCNQFKRKELCL